VAVPVWLAGTMVLLLGYATQGAALDRGKLVVVQQLLVATDRLGAATRLLAVEPARPRASGRYQANAQVAPHADRRARRGCFAWEAALLAHMRSLPVPGERSSAEVAYGLPTPQCRGGTEKHGCVESVRVAPQCSIGVPAAWRSSC
jgi:hypothetical protein